MSDSQFDLDTFMNASLSEPTVRRPPLQPGLILPGIIEDVKPRAWQSKDKYDANGQPLSGVAFDVKIKVDFSTMPEVVTQQGGITSLTMEDSIMLELTPSKQIDNSVGKNGKLRRYREALDMNKQGDAWSPRAMIGRPIKVKIGQRVYNNETYDQVADIVRAF